MITRIFLVRHGATPLTADDRFAGSSDMPLGPEDARLVLLNDVSHYDLAGGHA